MEPRISLITLGVSNLERSIRFYRDGLGFMTDATDDAPVAFFRTGGAILGLYPYDKLLEDARPGQSGKPPEGFCGVTIAHNTRSEEEADAVMAHAERAGATIVKPNQKVFWGGYSGYFADPDGYLWEVCFNPFFKFAEDGSLII